MVTPEMRVLAVQFCTAKGTTWIEIRVNDGYRQNWLTKKRTGSIMKSENGIFRFQIYVQLQ